jgi:hypothetical protein
LPQGQDPLRDISQLVPLVLEPSLDLLLAFQIEVQLLHVQKLGLGLSDLEDQLVTVPGSTIEEHLSRQGRVLIRSVGRLLGGQGIDLCLTGKPSRTVPQASLLEGSQGGLDNPSLLVKLVRTLLVLAIGLVPIRITLRIVISKAKSTAGGRARRR